MQSPAQANTPLEGISLGQGALNTKQDTGWLEGWFLALTVRAELSASPSSLLQETLWVDRAWGIPESTSVEGQSAGGWTGRT